MSLFEKNCEYCRKKIKKGKELFRDVKNPAFIGTKQKPFCCVEHANKYERDLEENMKRPKSKKSCCE